nr:PREDICTED: uncharacterized protein LOC103976049 isoform X1 [Musa acuminata subsp. malaccensis]XP_018675272.1 PREDICTED: uncharacterized protein LOC103976049 isoform X1 [Musa acuminata subsp. malaccensis]XP_018675279.1 PREDICTED: uncharacterized protein LOC103976049 isoform X1 [Musa acuminata subsp. malaccensis]
MEREHNRMHGTSRRDAVSESSSPTARSLGVFLSLDSSSQRIFMRTASLGRIGGTGYWQLGSIRPNLIVEGIPADTTRPAAAGDNQAIGAEMAGNGLKQGSLSRMSSRDSWPRGSISFSSDRGTIDNLALPQELIDKIDSSLAQVGCRGSRVDDKEHEDGVVTFADDSLILSFNSRSYEANLPSVVTPLTEEIVSPLPTDSILSTTGKGQMTGIASPKDKQYKLPFWLDYISYLSHLAVFGILGVKLLKSFLLSTKSVWHNLVYTRYLLQKLFGPGLLRLTGDNPLYLDLPSNMIGSFLMGWIGFVFKADILHVSEHLLVGLSTGYLGSLTTFSGWNQKMLESSSKGHWVYTVAGLILGTFLVNYSIIVGVGCAGGLRRIIIDWCEKRTTNLEKWRVDNRNKHVVVMAAFLLIWCLLWTLSGEFFRVKLNRVSNSAVLWLAFLVGPPGVWLRWRLARFNGQGIGSKRMLKWLPIGTLSANVLAAGIMAAVAIISKAVNTKRCSIIVSGFQLGFLGCLSTVSTFAAEIYGMWKTGHGWRAFFYIIVTIVPSFALGTLVYSVPIWFKHYES